MKKYNYIYKITNLVNGKIYIGKHSTDRMDDGYMGSGHRLHQAYTKYGQECFRKEVILFYTSEEELNRGEIYWIAKLNSTNLNIGYNLTYGGEGVLGHIHTDDTKRKMSEAKKGKPLSEGHRRKLSEVLKGRPFSEEHKQKLSVALKGKHHTEETKQKMSAVLKGKFCGENNPMYGKSPAIKGKHHTEETKQKMSEAKKGKVFTEEHRRNLSEATKLYWQRRKLAKLNQQTND